MDHRGRPRFFLFLTLVILTVVVLPVGIVLYARAMYLITPVRNREVGTPGDLPYETITLTTSDNLALSGWYIPGTRTEAVVLVHGMHANRTYLLPQANILSQAGYHSVLMDLRGHGNSEGEFMTYGYNEALDVAAAVEYLLALPEVEHVAVLGHSMGAAGVVRAAAADERIQGIVIQSSYSGVEEATADAFVKLSGLPTWPFAPLMITLAEWHTGVDLSQVNSSRDLRIIHCPVLIIHSTDDNVFPLYHAEQMYEAANNPKELWIVEGIAHINPMTGHEAAYEEKILAFLDLAFDD